MHPICIIIYSFYYSHVISIMSCFLSYYNSPLHFYLSPNLSFFLPFYLLHFISSSFLPPAFFLSSFIPPLPPFYASFLLLCFLSSSLPSLLLFFLTFLLPSLLSLFLPSFFASFLPYFLASFLTSFLPFFLSSSIPFFLPLLPFFSPFPFSTMPTTLLILSYE